MFQNVQQSLFSTASSAWAIHGGSTRRLARQEGATITTFVTEAEDTPAHAISWHEALVRGRARQPTATPRYMLGVKDPSRTKPQPCAQPCVLRIQSAVWKKLPLSRVRKSSGTPVSPIAWSMQPSHWSRSLMPMVKGMWRSAAWDARTDRCNAEARPASRTGTSTGAGGPWPDGCHGPRVSPRTAAPGPSGHRSARPAPSLFLRRQSIRTGCLGEVFPESAWAYCPAHRNGR